MPDGQLLKDFKLKYPDARRFEVSPYPELVHYEVLYACNNRCSFCYNPDTMNESQKVDRGLIRAITARLAEQEIPHFYFIGGEVSLLGQAFLNELIDLMVGHSSVTVVTNGVKCLEDIHDGLACIGVSFHGSTAEMHEAVNNTPGSFVPTLAAMKHYVRRGLHLRVVPLLCQKNVHDMRNIFQTVAELGAHSVYVDKYEIGGKGAHARSMYSIAPDDIRRCVDDLIWAREAFPQTKFGFGTAVPFCIDNRLREEKLFSTCGTGTWFLALRPNGDVRTCNQSDLVLGNVLRDNLSAIWNNPILDYYRIPKHWMTEPCSSCEMRFECRGGCSVRADSPSTWVPDPLVAGQKPLAPASRSDVEMFSVNKERQPSSSRWWLPNRFEKSPFLKLQTLGGRRIVSRYATTWLDDSDDLVWEMTRAIVQENVFSEWALWKRFARHVPPWEIRRFTDTLRLIDAVSIVN